MTREELIREIEARSNQFKQLVSGVDEEAFESKRIDGRWGYREVVSHLTGWQGQLAAGLKQASRQENPAPIPDGQAAMAWNDALAEHARGKRQEQVLQEFDDGVETFLSAARSAPDSLFQSGGLGERLGQEDLRRFDEHIEMVRRAG